MSTSVDSTNTSKAYLEYIEGRSVHQEDIMIHVGEQVGKEFDLY